LTTAAIRVAYDVTPVISGRTGIARYVTELAAALEPHPVTLLPFAVGRAAFTPPAGTRRLGVPARVVGLFWRRLSWPAAEFLVSQPDVVHATGLLTPPTRRPLVVTVHDVAALRYPDLHPARHVQQQQRQLAELRRAAVIVTVSQATADDLAHLGVATDRIVVAPLGVKPLSERAEQDPPPTQGRPYVLTVGESSPRKGYPVLLEALARVENLDLVMAGPPAGDEPRVRSLIDRLQLRERVRRLGAVSDTELASLYRGARALCFPSVAEGFGLPVLEAMQAGLPVLASDIAPTRELAGSAAVFLPCDDADAWSQALRDALGDREAREAMVRIGRDRAASYTWGRTADATLRAYRIAAGA
jgi:glycosyltransferase involved in cell wall biosynthesis